MKKKFVTVISAAAVAGCWQAAAENFQMSM